MSAGVLGRICIKGGQKGGAPKDIAAKAMRFHLCPMLSVFSACPLLTVAFGEPEHGWLPVTLQADDFKLAFYASDVPVNPLELLCEALAVVPAGGSAKVLWPLEPAVYWFAFEKQGKEISLEITEAPRYNHPGISILRLTGSMQEVLRPFYKALAEFTSHKFSEEHWPALAANRVQLLGQLLRSQR